MIKNSTIKVSPSTLEGTVEAPPSKSLSHRALICAALSNGKSTISNLVYSQDILATMSALESLGARFDITGSTVLVHGIKRLKLANKEIDCNESGSTLRFMIPIFSVEEIFGLSGILGSYW